MLRRYAIVKDFWVDEIVFLEKPELRELSKMELIYDVEDTPEVDVGWFFAGNRFTAPDSMEAADHAEELIARELINPAGTAGETIVKEIRDLIGARNIRLGVTESQISSLVQNLASIRLLMEGGALKTSRSLILMIKPAYPQYADIFDYAVERINQNVK